MDSLSEIKQYNKAIYSSQQQANLWPPPGFSQAFNHDTSFDFTSCIPNQSVATCTGRFDAVNVQNYIVYLDQHSLQKHNSMHNGEQSQNNF